MNWNRLKPWFYIGVLLAALIFLFIRTQDLDPERHNRILDTLRQLKAIDSTLNQDVLRIRYGLLHNYDPLVAGLNRMDELIARLESGDDDLREYRQKDIDDALGRFAALVDNKHKDIERFKTERATLINSLRFFPTAAEEAMKLDQLYPAKFHHELEELIAVTLSHSALPQPDNQRRLHDLIFSLETAYSEFPEEVQYPLKVLMAHAKIIADQQTSLSALLRSMVSSPTASTLDDLQAHYLDYYEQLSKRVSHYRLALFMVSLLLLLYIGRVVYRIHRLSCALQASVHDLNQQKAELAKEKERAQVTLHSIGDGVITTSESGSIESLNPVAEEIIGWKTEEVRGHLLSSIVHLYSENTLEPVRDPIGRCLRSGEIVTLEQHTVMLDRHGREVPISDTAAPIRDAQGSVLGAVMVFHDISNERQLRHELSYQARHDALTGLFNRREFEKRLQSRLEQVQNGEATSHVLIFMDLDQFKVVNDTSGHVAGDELLRQLAATLSQRVRATDTLARLGGDEFGVLLEHCSIEQAMGIAEQIRSTIEDFRFSWEEETFGISVSIGMAEVNANSTSLTNVLSTADLACYAAKEAGRNRIHALDPSDTDLHRRRREMRWVTRINEALEEEDFVLYVQAVQPLNDLAASPSHYEVLVRLRNPDGSVTLPGAFIPSAERYDIMPRIDRWVVEHVFSWLERKGNGSDLPHLAINISGTSLNDETFLDYVLNRMEVHRTPPGLISFEITETAAIASLAQATSFIQELRKRGCHFALDDFGRGLSSFAYLKNLQVDYIKIDGSFIRDMLEDPMDEAMVEAINRIGHVMQLQTIAEYVDRPELVLRLRDLGIDYAQGYETGKPRPIIELAETLPNAG
jgi:diguanylate cyclase (GGDEF)-like protein/PAS domain S-box-containing protein